MYMRRMLVLEYPRRELYGCIYIGLDISEYLAYCYNYHHQIRYRFHHLKPGMLSDLQLSRSLAGESKLPGPLKFRWLFSESLYRPHGASIASSTRVVFPVSVSSSG